jgi:hypothetical protein
MQNVSIESQNSHGLQFDKAEFSEAESATPTCEMCQSSLRDVYYEVNSQVTCETCKHNIDKSQKSGGGVGRFVKALAFGLPAAAVGAGIYYAISALTGYEFGLVAVIIGLMVGGAVRVGSSCRGGRVYQTLAMVLTYLAIVSTYVPYAIQGLIEEAGKEGIVEHGRATDQEQHEMLTETDATQPVSIPTREKRNETTGPANNEPVKALTVLIGIAVLLIFAMALPFLAGFENIIGFIIIGIGLYEAWKLNKRQEFQIQGPFQIGTKNA